MFGSPAARVLLCPFHSDGSHVPAVAVLTKSGTPARMSCSCDRWVGSLVESVLAGVREWQRHVLMTLGDT